MRTFPWDTLDAEIKALVLEWSDLLAAKEYAQALNMFLAAEQEVTWTPDLLAATIKGYGVPDSDPETMDIMHKTWGVTEFVVSPSCS